MLDCLTSRADLVPHVARVDSAGVSSGSGSPGGSSSGPKQQAESLRNTAFSVESRILRVRSPVDSGRKSVLECCAVYL